MNKISDISCLGIVKTLEMTDDEIKKNKDILKKILKQNNDCEALGISECINHDKMHLTLERNNGILEEVYIQCPKFKFIHKIQQNYIYVSEVLKKHLITTFDNNFLHNNNISNYNKKIIERFLSYNITSNNGFYLYGENGIGKTYFAMMFSNEFIKNNKKNIAIDMNDFIYLCQNSKINENLIENMKKCDLLFFDDIGNNLSEKTYWIYQAYIHPILKYRLECNKICIFTSNYPIQTLKNKFLRLNKMDQIEANTIISVIKRSCNNLIFPYAKLLFQKNEDKNNKLLN